MLARLAGERPDNLRIRLDRPAVLFALGRDDEAGALFREVRRRGDLPDDARRKVEGFLANLLARQRLLVDLDLGLWYDGNVNNTAEANTVASPAFGDLWTGLALAQALDPDWRAGIVPRISTTHYDNQPDEVDPVGGSPALSVSRRTALWDLGPGWLTAGAALARERLEAPGLRLRSRGLSLEYAADVGEDWSGSVRLGLSDARFDEQDAAFLVRREDRTQTLGLPLSHRRVAWEGYQPVLMLDGSRADSTIPLYDRTLLQVRVGLHQLF